MEEFVTFTELVLARAAASPTADAQIHLDDDGAAGMTAEVLCYGGLDRAARRIAALLSAEGAAQQPVLLLFPAGLAFLQAFTGCLYARMIAVPAPVAEQRAKVDRLSGILRDSGARIVLTDAAHRADVCEQLARLGRTDVVVLATDDATDDAAGDPAAGWRLPEQRADDIAFLQYTSGSTSEPRGVVVTHRNLLANQRAMQQGMGTSRQDRIGSWLPHFHDMGLVLSLLHPLWLGTSSVTMSPFSFLKRPFRWLATVADYGVTVTAGPNFCYDLCLRRVSDEQLARLDLSGWRLALNGAEPVRAATMKAFASRFAAAGFRARTLSPGYGLAEATLFVSCTPPQRRHAVVEADVAALETGELRPAAPGRRKRRLVGCGPAVGTELRVVDPGTGAVLPDGRTGEVWLRGASVAGGYWRRPELSAQVFGRELDGEGGWFRTGDLGARLAGEIYVTGRLKDLMVLNGRNLHPQDLEWAVGEAHPAFAGRQGAVFTVDTDPEQLVVVQEVAPAVGPEQWDELVLTVRHLLGREFDVAARNVVLVPPGTVPTTTSGKVQRSRTRADLLRGALPALHLSLDPDTRDLLAAGEPAAEAADGELVGGRRP